MNTPAPADQAHDARPANPRTLGALLQAAFDAGALHGSADPLADQAADDAAFAAWRRTLLPDREPEPEADVAALFNDDDLCGCDRPDEADNPHRHPYAPDAGCRVRPQEDRP